MSAGPVAIGIFVGGSGRRLGGVAKGMLRTPAGDETLVERLLRVCRRVAPEASVSLVGEASQYAALGVRVLLDAPSGVGPLGGLRALLLRAHADGARTALALACDLPFLDESVVARLIAPLIGAARVPVADGRDQPLAAAYAPELTLDVVDGLLARAQHRVLGVLDELGAHVERVTFDGVGAGLLRDWDTPDDVQRSR